MIYYFSGTGNTEWAARRIAEATGETLYDMAAGAAGAPQDGEIVGFCFPVHGWRPPKIVRRFIAGLHIEGRGRYCFALATCGDSTGRCMDILQRDLGAIGLRADSLFSILMPESYVALPLFRTDPKPKEQAKIAAAEKALTTEIIPAIKARRPGIASLERGYLPYTYTYVLGAWFNRYRIDDGPFRVDSDLCVGCSRCAKACPTDNIEMSEDGRPVWKHDGSCTACLACYHHCPHHAIEYGRWTKGKGQYYFSVRKVEN